MPLLKTLERAIRQGTMNVLRLTIRRGKPLPETFDFNAAKVLFLRQNQIGDTLISTPIFAALKKKYPAITLDVLLDKRNATTLDNDANIHQRWILKQNDSAFKILSRVRAERYDIVADLIHTPSTTSTLFAAFSDARFTIGFERENDFVYDIKVPFNPEPRMLLALAEILRAFHIVPQPRELRPYFTLSESSKTFAADVIRASLSPEGGSINNLPEKKARVIGINISASLKLKFWGTENFIDLIRLLGQRFTDAAFLILYSAAYRDEAVEIAARSSAALCPPTKTLSDFAAVISKLNALITPDSAAVHLADAFMIPVAVLTHNPHGVTAWYPSFTRFVSVHSNDGTVKSILVQDALVAAIEVMNSR
jgi:ADP-heptose:LPS heptosyltransferase